MAWLSWDGYVGQLLKKLDDLGVANNTIVVFTTDNGAEVMSWPDGGTTPFRGEKATNWEGGYRVPMVIRWPGAIQPSTSYNEMFSHYDLIPTFAAAGGNLDIVNQCLQGAQIGGKPFKVHLDGFNLIPFLKGEVKKSPRKEFIYWNDDGQLVAIRFDQWKCVFLEQNNKGIGVWQGQFSNLRVPKLFNLRADPLEQDDSQSSMTNGWWTVYSYRYRCKPWQQTGFQVFRVPVRQKPASFNLDEVMEKLEKWDQAETDDHNIHSRLQCWRLAPSLSWGSTRSRPARGFLGASSSTCSGLLEILCVNGREKMSDQDSANSSKSKSNAVNRRKMLLAGTTLVAASALPAVSAVQTAQAQAQPAASSQQPNVIVIMGDDIGWSNIGVYNQGIMAGRTPIWTGWPARACALPTIMQKQVAPPVEQISLLANCQFGPALRQSDKPAPP